MPPIYKSYAFWTLVVGFLVFVAKYFYPAFPLSQEAILALVVFVLGALGIQVEARVRSLW